MIYKSNFLPREFLFDICLCNFVFTGAVICSGIWLIRIISSRFKTLKLGLLLIKSAPAWDMPDEATNITLSAPKSSLQPHNALIGSGGTGF